MFMKLVGGLAIASVLWPAAATAKNYVTPSGRVLCVLTPDPTVSSPTPDEQYDAAVCQGEFTQPGAAFNVMTTGDGSLSWSNANLAVDNPTIRMVYQRNYHWGIWTIRTAPAGTKITNSRTGHGMYVSIDRVYAF